MQFYLETLQYWPFLLQGLGWTVLISVAAMAGGFVLGLMTSICRDHNNRVFRRIASAYVDIFRTTPLFIQLLWIYYALPLLTGWSLSGIPAGILGMSLHAGAYLTEVIRAGIHSVDSGQSDAALALGMSRRQVFSRVVLPQALINMLPAVGNVLITTIKATSLLSVVAVPDLLRNSTTISSLLQRDLEPLTIAAFMYLLLTLPISAGIGLVQRRRKVSA
ncbi:amino acid ABC transporter permease [Paenarthrobacter sp. NPDC057981]|uniref:amino acid ABC transporter permease n=1 Tax=Paenarthrobacter sp. NPDC057981 TaxID=3346297 RepID=UPI0036D9C696